MKAFEVEYRVKVIAYGNTAREAEANGKTLFRTGESVSLDLADDAEPDWSAVVRYQGAATMTSKTRRVPGEDAE